MEIGEEMLGEISFPATTTSGNVNPAAGTTVFPLIDHNHPLFLQLTDTPGRTLISLQLTSSNNYEKVNVVVLSWIMNAVKTSLLSSVVYASNAHKVWEDLKERFDKINGSRVLYLHRETNLTQGTMSIAEYFSKILQFLKGLNESYSQSRSQTMMMSPIPSINKAYSLLIDQGSQRSLANFTQTSHIVESIEEVVFYSIKNPTNVGGNFKFRKNQVQYEYCHYKGHTMENCFKLHGYPSNFKGKKKRQSSGAYAKSILQMLSKGDGEGPESSTKLAAIGSLHLLGEGDCNEFEQLLSSLGIFHQSTCVYTPQQNGIIERKHRTILDMVQVFDCVCYAAYPGIVYKFSPRAILVVFLGYSSSQKGYVLYELNSKSLFVNRNVVFQEDIFPFKNMLSSGSTIFPIMDLISPISADPRLPTTDSSPDADVSPYEVGATSEGETPISPLANPHHIPDQSALPVGDIHDNTTHVDTPDEAHTNFAEAVDAAAPSVVVNLPNVIPTQVRKSSKPIRCCQLIQHVLRATNPQWVETMKLEIAALEENKTGS
ncbi:uncharacterized protein LOC142176482 [Nicotiana tabacum]|uniref:Uncharacterized protein LOC142176482 n=1 Tax=Nicotiana tabacum TaxID=4097 RepID=A0AC58TTB5_TOBAC